MDVPVIRTISVALAGVPVIGEQIICTDLHVPPRTVTVAVTLVVWAATFTVAVAVVSDERIVCTH